MKGFLFWLLVIIAGITAATLVLLVGLILGAIEILARTALLLRKSFESWTNFAVSLICLFSLAALIARYPSFALAVLIILAIGTSLNQIGAGLGAFYAAYRSGGFEKAKRKTTIEDFMREVRQSSLDESIARLSKYSEQTDKAEWVEVETENGYLEQQS